MNHKQKLVKVNVFVDEGIAETIRLLNAFKNLQTLESCEGTQEAFIVFKCGESGWGETANFIFEYLAPKFIAMFGDRIDISVRMNSLGNIQGELVIKKEIIKKLNKHLRKITSS